MDYKEKSGGLHEVMWRQGERLEATRRRTLQQAGVGCDLIIEASRENGYIKVSVYERSEGGERTLRPYEHVEVAWEQIEASRREVISLLNRANRRAKVTREILESLKKSGQVLFDLLVPSKAREKLSSTEACNLILYVDDKLVHIPWELLFDGRQFLCRRFAMGRIVRTRQAPTALSSRTPKAPFKVLVLADPRGDLDASYREGIEIKNFLDEKRDIFHVDFKSHPVDVSFVKKNLRDYDIVHYAGHADYRSENPSESGWLLKDARLKAGEISAMGGLQPMPSLVFSNACQSGHSGEWRIGEEDEQQIFGLANAYLLSGVQHYIGTFWEILDEPSSQFAKLFYGSVSQGESVGEAVRKAREKLIEAHGEETIVWAGYMLYGDPTFAFDPAEKEEEMEEPVVRDIASPEWSPVMRGHGAVATAAAKPRRFTLGFLLLGALVLVCGGIAGYVYFFQPDDQHPLAVSAFTPAIPDATGTSKNESVESSKEAAVPAPTGETNQEKSPDSVKMKDPFSPNLLKTAAAKPAAVVPPVAAPQAPAPPMEVQNAALKKDLPQSVVTVPLTLSMNIIGQRKEADGSYTEVLVSEGGVLRSYDNFQVHLETNRPAYVYILLYDSQGSASQMFPDPKIDQRGFLEQGRKVVVPARDLWFWLDEHTGTETIYVLTSEKPMSDIQGLLAKMEAVDDDAGKKRVAQEIKQRIAIVQRGVGGITKGQAVTYTLSDGKKIQKVTEVVTGTESVVRAVSFLHR
jgi:CHAT domain-containing protein